MSVNVSGFVKGVVATLAVVVILCVIAVKSLGTQASANFRSVGSAIAPESRAGADFKRGATVREDMFGAANVVAFAQGEAAGGEQAAAAPKQIHVPRKIIYSATVSLVVQDFLAAEKQIPDLVKKHGGYVADAQQNRNQGVRQTGNWVLRVPVDRFDELIKSLVDLGVPETQRISTQDVSEEFFDTQTRVTNKKEIEKRLLALLTERKGDIKEVVEVEMKLGQVREEIERLQGRLNFLANRVDLSMITLSIREEKEYIPPQAPGFAGQVANTWSRSVRELQQAGVGTALFVVALTPWLPVILAAGAAIWWAARRRPKPVAA